MVIWGGLDDNIRLGDAPRERRPRGRWWLGGLVLGVLMGICQPAVQAGMVGFPSARQQALRLRVELAGDSFKEDLNNSVSATATTGRALMSVALGLTDWSEIFARVGTAEFNLANEFFRGDFGLAFGGGVRLRLFSFPIGSIGLSGQYLRFTSNDDDSAGDRLEGEWQEVDAVLGFGSRRFGAFAFYAGGVFHHSEITLENRRTRAQETFESDLPFRLLLGVHIFPLIDVPSGRLLINLEARVIGETPQFTLGVQYAF